MTKFSLKEKEKGEKAHGLNWNLLGFATVRFEPEPEEKVVKPKTTTTTTPTKEIPKPLKTAISITAKRSSSGSLIVSRPHVAPPEET